jgi:hypothetical protein
VRITITSSEGYKAVKQLNYEMFTRTIGEIKNSKRGAMLEGIKRYLNSKLGMLYIALELNKRLQEEGTKNIHVNAVHPGEHLYFPVDMSVLMAAGNAARTQIGNWTQGDNMTAKGVQRVKKLVFLGGLLSNTTEDSAKTQTYLSAFAELPNNTTGQFWAPSVSFLPLPGFWMRYKRCQAEKLKPNAVDEKSWKKFWDFCAEAMAKVKSATTVTEKDIVHENRDNNKGEETTEPAMINEDGKINNAG